MDTKPPLTPWTESIAIVGMGCRFPGNIDSPSAMWSFLRDGGDGITPIPEDRWDRDAFFDARKEQPGTIYARRGGFLDKVDRFDPQAFGI